LITFFGILLEALTNNYNTINERTMNAFIQNRLDFTRRLGTPAGIFDTERPDAIDYQSVMVLKQQHCLALIPLYWMSDVHMTHTSTGGERFEEGYKETMTALTAEFVAWANQYTNRFATLEIFDSMEEFHDAYGIQGFDAVKFWRPDASCKALLHATCECEECVPSLFHLNMSWNLMQTDIDQIVSVFNLMELATAGDTLIGEENARKRIKRVVTKMLLTTYSYPVWCLWRTRLCIRIGGVVPEEDAPMFLNADRCICCAHSFKKDEVRYTAEKFCKEGTEVCASCYEHRIIPTTNKKSSKWEGNVCLTGNHDSPETKALLETMLDSQRRLFDELLAQFQPQFAKMWEYFGLIFKNPIPVNMDKILRKGSMIDLSSLFWVNFHGEWLDDSEIRGKIYKSSELRGMVKEIWERIFCIGQGSWDMMYSHIIQRKGAPPREETTPKITEHIKDLFEKFVRPHLCVLLLTVDDAVEAKIELRKTAEAQLLASAPKKEKKVQEKTAKQLQAEATRLANQVQKQKKKDAEAFAEKAEKAEAKRRADQVEKARRIAKAKKANMLKCAGLL
jgi:hypothetical protein